MARRFRPWHGLVLVVLFTGAFLYADMALDGNRSAYQRVSPDPQSREVRVPVDELEPGQLSFYRFLNEGNQEVKFFVGRDAAGHVQVGFDANEICFKRKRGYEHDGEWLVCRVCDKSFRLAEVNDGGGGCKPVPVRHRVEGDEAVLAEADILVGWRYFR